MFKRLNLTVRLLRLSKDALAASIRNDVVPKGAPDFFDFFIFIESFAEVFRFFAYRIGELQSDVSARMHPGNNAVSPALGETEFFPPAVGIFVHAVKQIIEAGNASVAQIVGNRF